MYNMLIKRNIQCVHCSSKARDVIAKTGHQGSLSPQSFHSQIKLLISRWALWSYWIWLHIVNLQKHLELVWVLPPGDMLWMRYRGNDRYLEWESGLLSAGRGFSTWRAISEKGSWLLQGNINSHLKRKTVKWHIYLVCDPKSLFF